MHDPVALAQQLVRLDTRAGGEKPAAELLAGLLSDAGFQVALEEPVANRANLIARLGERTPITLTGHLDTVPADAADWSFDPHSGEVVDDRLRGRGSSDMKGGVAALASAAIRYAFDGGTGVQLVFTFGEETGCEGARQLDSALLGPSDVLLVAEPTANRVVLGHKGVTWLRLTARGRSAHGSRPDLGENALVVLAEAAVRVHRAGSWPVSPTHGPVTVNVGTFAAGTQPNLVPDHAEMQLDVRTVPEFGSDDAVRAITELSGPGIAVERVLDVPGVGSDAESPAVRRVADVLQPGWRPEYATYSTDASVLKDRLSCHTALICGPGEPEQAHTVDESCSAAAIERNAEAVFRLLVADSGR